VMRATALNESSSRSHAILRLVVRTTATLEDGRTVSRAAKLNLVDLAGSEKWAPSGMVDTRIKEMTHINKSLSCLGDCISALTDPLRKHVPYRNSKLTVRRKPGFSLLLRCPSLLSPLQRILQDSLGGNTMTTLIATLSPSSTCDETVSTLKFADRAHQVLTKVTANEVVDDAAQLAAARVRLFVFFPIPVWVPPATLPCQPSIYCRTSGRNPSVESGPGQNDHVHVWRKCQQKHGGG
jgi:hypothetical protein